MIRLKRFFLTVNQAISLLEKCCGNLDLWSPTIHWKHPKLQLCFIHFFFSKTALILQEIVMKTQLDWTGGGLQALWPALSWVAVCASASGRRCTGANLERRSWRAARTGRTRPCQPHSGVLRPWPRSPCLYNKWWGTAAPTHSPRFWVVPEIQRGKVLAMVWKGSLIHCFQPDLWERLQLSVKTGGGSRLARALSVCLSSCHLCFE